MAAALTPVTPGRHGKKVSAVGDLFLIVFEVTLSGSYATGGEDLRTTLQNLLKQKGNGTVYAVSLLSHSGYQISYDDAAGKMMVHQGDNANAGVAPGIQLPAAAYPAALTARTVRGFCIGL